MNGLLAINSFEKYPKKEKELFKNWELMQATGVVQTTNAVIGSSWERCLSHQVNSLCHSAPTEYSDSKLKIYKERNKELLNLIWPYMKDLFNQFAPEDILVMLSDPSGIILDGIATSKAWSLAEKINFVPGANWSEECVGTNAIGTAIAESQPIQVFATEHFCQKWHPWVCSAVPIRDPLTKELLGILDITGPKDRVQAHNFPLIYSQVKKIQRDCGIQFMSRDILVLKGLTECLHEPVFIFDSNLKIIQSNIFAQNLLGSYGYSRVSSLIDVSIENVYDFPFWGQKVPVHVGGRRDEWVASFHPYRLGNRLIGGIALLEMVKSSIVNSNVSCKHYTFDKIITQDRLMISLIEKVKRAAIYDKTLLITGETGTGKEMFVQSLHSASIRANKKFVAINCGAIPKELIASELFGYAPGAFTGALIKGKPGKFLLANGGTLFLDEIGELPLEAQAYLLRVIEERAVLPVGGVEAISVDVRIIAATNRDLTLEVAQGRFRDDLYYRLNVLNFRIPPLRERKRDIPLLVQHFLGETTSGGVRWKVEDSVQEALESYDWPGNVRQLKHVLDQMVFCAENFLITQNDLPPEIKNHAQSVLNKEHSINESLSPNNKPVIEKTKPDLTREVILEALVSTGQNVSEAARRLKVSRMTLYRKLKQDGLTSA